MKCKKCGSELNQKSKFCGKCGNKTEEEILSTDTAQQKKITVEKKSPLASIVSVIVFILAIGIGRYLTQGAFSPTTNSNTRNSTYSNTDLINQTVKEVKANITLPNHIDKATTLVDITAEPSAIRYHYVLSDVDTTNFTNDSLKNYLGTSICQNKDTKNLIDQGINVEYSYVVENTEQSYFVSFTKTDCLQ